MPPRSSSKKRKSPTRTSASKKRKDAVSKGPSGSKHGAFSLSQCRKWFDSYRAADGEEIDPEGTMKLCEDLDVTPENVVMLIIAWKLGCKQMATFTWAEWLHGMQQCQCDNAVKLKALLPTLLHLLEEPMRMKELHRYAYDFCRSALENPAQRSIDTETAKVMLRVMYGQRWTQLDRFLTFLDEVAKVKVVNKDQWANIFEFYHTILPDLSNYDENSAWPVLLDEYVEWVKEQEQ